MNCVSLRGGNRHHRSNQRHHQHTTHSGSLQDLVEAVHTELDSDYSIGGGGGSSTMQQRRHQNNNGGRHQKKYSSSVSARTYAGGSLPTNVNCNLYDETFLNELNKGNTTTRNNRAMPSSSTVSAASTSKHNKNHQQQQHQNDGGNFVWLGYEPTAAEQHQVSHTVIEIESDETRHLLAHDSLAQVNLVLLFCCHLILLTYFSSQGILDPTDEHTSGGAELNPMKKLPRIAVSYTATQFMNVSIGGGGGGGGDASTSASFRPVTNHASGTVDKTVRFNSFLKGARAMEQMMNETAAAAAVAAGGGSGRSSGGVQLNNSYASVNSVIEQKGPMSLAGSNAIASTSSNSSGSSTCSSQVCFFILFFLVFVL